MVIHDDASFINPKLKLVIDKDWLNKLQIWNMETLILYPKSKEQLSAFKAMAKALKVDFETEKSPYDPAFVAKIKQSQQDLKEGKGTVITIDELKELCK